jgi:polyisoprenoid-binding protein YceI
MVQRRFALPVVPLLLSVVALACNLTGQSAKPTETPAAAAATASATEAATATAAGAEPATQTGATQPAATPGDSASTTQASGTPASGAIHLNLVADGTQARYRVREQLANISLPSDAIGKTSAVTGSLVINDNGMIVADQSKFVVDLTGLQSDRSQRDHWLQGHILESDQYPTAEFDAFSVSGLPSPLPTSGPVTFKISGNLTAHGTTKPATWDVTAQIANNTELSGTATTSFTFEDYNIELPRVPMVLSVVDKITLELDFHLVKTN